MGFAATFDERADALKICRIEGAPVDREELQLGLLDAYERLLARDQPHVMIWDLRELPGVPREVRQYLTAWRAIHDQRIRAQSLASVTLFSSQPLRWFFTALFLIQPPSAQRYRVMTQMVPALRWGVTVLQTAGIEVPNEALETLIAEHSEPPSLRMLA